MGSASFSRLSVALTLASASVIAPTGAVAAFTGANGRIAFEGETTHGLQIFSMGPGGSRIHALTKNAGDNAEPAYSADGRGVAYVADGTKLILIRADGSHKQAVLTAKHLAQPTFASNGQRLIFSVSDRRRSQIWQVRVDGSRLRRLTSIPAMREKVFSRRSRRPSAARGAGIGAYVKRYHRPHSRLDYRTPKEVRQMPGTRSKPYEIKRA